MRTEAVVPTHLLTPMEDRVNRFNAKPGMLTLNVKNISGKTDLDAANSTVKDITDSASPIAVSRACTQSRFSFQVEAGKTYHIALAFIQTPSPHGSVAELEEGGQKIDTIDLTNLFPGFVVYA
jgi:hypothetical protein